ncbi:hypothetical protein, partial [Paenibacillus sp. GCM10023250]|uniref:hypothetical protein n=1 Tax=Paenibacillus sp. GCM10023250 TaxID=3252648 RepID=UPI00360973E8
RLDAAPRCGGAWTRRFAAAAGAPGRGASLRGRLDAALRGSGGRAGPLAARDTGEHLSGHTFRYFVRSSHFSNYTATRSAIRPQTGLYGSHSRQ